MVSAESGLRMHWVVETFGTFEAATLRELARVENAIKADKKQFSVVDAPKLMG